MATGPQKSAAADLPLAGLQAVSKSFDGVRVLDRVSFDIRAGETHVLAGENGAGKSTLMRVLGGVYPDYEGTIRLGGRPVRFASPHQAALRGIAMIHQELSLIPALPVVDNLFLGRERAAAGGWMRHREQRREAAERLRQLGADLDVTRPAGDYPVAVRQLVEIAKALVFRSRILVLDEPTSALNAAETRRLFAIIRGLRDAGCGLVFITHKLEEIYEIGDRLTILRDGRTVATTRPCDLPRDELVRRLVGRDLAGQFPARRSQPGAVRLSVRGLSLPDPANPRRRALEGISFDVHRGEILGFAGLRGSGASELFQALFGVYGPVRSGRAALEGRPYVPRSPRRALAAGLALLTNDRKGNGLSPRLSVAQNITLASLAAYSPGGWLRPERERAAARAYGGALGIRMASPDQEIRTLSGGNQQKALLARWLACRPAVLLLDEPTRGVDVGAKHELYGLMNRWTAEGLSIMLIASELPELLAMADRVMVLHRGRITGLFERAEAAPDRVLKAALGVSCA